MQPTLNQLDKAMSTDVITNCEDSEVEFFQADGAAAIQSVRTFSALVAVLLLIGFFANGFSV